MLKIKGMAFAAAAAVLILSAPAIGKPPKTVPPPASDFQNKPEPPTPVPTKTEQSPEDTAKPFLSLQKGKISATFMYPKPGELCGNAGLYSLTIPSPLEKESDVIVYVSRDTLKVWSDPPKVFDYSIFRGSKDDLKVVLYGLNTGAEQTINIKAYSENSNPGENPLYDKNIKLKLEPDKMISFAVSAKLDEPPAFTEDTVDGPPPEPPAPTEPVKIGVMGMPLKKMPVDIDKEQPPFQAAAGPDFHTLTNQETTLKGNSAQAGPQKTIRYTWRQISGPRVELSGWDTTTAKFTPVKPGIYVFEYEIYDGSNISLDSVTVNVKGASFFFASPSIFSKLDIGFTPSTFVQIGNMLIIPNGTEAGTTNNDSNLLFVDISDPKKPELKTNYQIDYEGVKSIRLMVSSGSFIYAVYGKGKGAFHLVIMNVSNMENPRIVGGMPIKGTPKLIVPGEGLLYLCTIESGVQVIDVRQPGKPTLKSTFTINEDIATGALSGRTFMLVTRTKLLFLDASNPEILVEAASIPIKLSFTNDSLVVGSNILVFAAPTEDSPLLKGDTMPLFTAYDVSDPANPKPSGELIGKIGMLRSNAVNGNYLYLIHVIRETQDGKFVEGNCYLEVYDLTDMGNIKKVSTFETDLTIQTMKVMGDYVIYNKVGEIIILRVSG